MIREEFPRLLRLGAGGVPRSREKPRKASSADSAAASASAAVSNEAYFGAAARSVSISAWLSTDMNIARVATNRRATLSPR